MRKWLYLTVLALALLSLALGGWTLQAVRSVVRPGLRPRPLHSAPDRKEHHDSRR